MAAPSAHECTDHPGVVLKCGVAPVDAQRLPVCRRHKKFARCRQWQTKRLLERNIPLGSRHFTRPLVAYATQVVALLQPGPPGFWESAADQEQSCEWPCSLNPDEAASCRCATRPARPGHPCLKNPSTLNLPATSPQNPASPSLRPNAVCAILPGHERPAGSSLVFSGEPAPDRPLRPCDATPEPSL